MKNPEQVRWDQEIKLIAIDLDGTLLNEQDDITERTIEKLGELVSMGIQIVPATGRCAALIHKKLLSIPDIHYGITENGASLWDFQTQDSLRTILLPAGTAGLIFSAMEQEKGYIELFADGIAYADRKDIEICKNQVDNPFFLDYFLKDHEFVEGLSSRKDLCARAEKINLFYMEDRVRLPLTEQLQRTGRYQVTSSLRGNMELNAANANKGSALKELCSYLNISLEHTMAIGDGDNDIEMMMSAGVGIAMGNGDPRVKQAAAYVTKSNDEEGVLWVLNQLTVK